MSLFSLVSDFKKQIEKEMSIPAIEQRLVLNGKALTDAKLLYDYKLATGATIHLMRKPGATSTSEAEKEESAIQMTKSPLFNEEFWKNLRDCFNKHFESNIAPKVCSSNVSEYLKLSDLQECL